MYCSRVPLTTIYAQIGQGPGEKKLLYPGSWDNEYQSCNYNFLTPQLYMQFAGLQSCTKHQQRAQMGF